MKKIVCILLSALLVLSLVSCGSTKSEEKAAEVKTEEKKETKAEEKKEEPKAEEKKEEPKTEAPAEKVAVPNPMTEYDSLEALNQDCGTNLVAPGVMGKSDEKYFSIKSGENKLAQYDFTVAGVEYSLRCTCIPTGEDISGVYAKDGLLFADGAMDTVRSFEGGMGISWMNIDGQFCLIAKGDITEETFKMVAQEIQDVCSTFDTENEKKATYESLVGDYADSFSQRAMATVALAEEKGIKITVDWASSAMENTQWTMTAIQSEDGLFYYNDCEKTTHIVDDKGTETLTTEYQNGEGYFSLTENNELSWDGAAEEDCKECVFEKMIY